MRVCELRESSHPRVQGERAEDETVLCDRLFGGSVGGRGLAPETVLVGFI